MSDGMLEIRDKRRTEKGELLKQKEWTVQDV